MNTSVIEASRGEDNLFNVDLSTDIDAGDKVWFRAAPTTDELTDADATIKKGLNVVGQGGVFTVDLPAGICQVQIDKADTAALTDEALVFEVVLFKADTTKETTVASGILRLIP